MKRVILLHGTCDESEYFNDAYPSLSNSHWFPWLQKELLKKGMVTQTPEMPEAYLPNYALWKSEFEQFTIDAETVLVGHSCGGGFLVRWLSENKVGVKKLILVAPWLDPNRGKTTDFFEFEIDPLLQERIPDMHVLVSDDDETDIQESVRKITSVLTAAQVHPFHGMGHFTLGSMKTNKFPELCNLIVGD